MLAGLNDIIFFVFTQVTCEYYFSHGACVPKRVHTVVVSVQHSEKISLADLRTDVMEKVVKAVIPDRYLDERTIYHINPCGEFVLGGPKVNKIHVFFAFTTRQAFSGREALVSDPSVDRIRPDPMGRSLVIG